MAASIHVGDLARNKGPGSFPRTVSQASIANRLPLVA